MSNGFSEYMGSIVVEFPIEHISDEAFQLITGQSRLFWVVLGTIDEHRVDMAPTCMRWTCACGATGHSNPDRPAARAHVEHIAEMIAAAVKEAQ